MKEKQLFFKKYLSQMGTIGALVPSSRYLARAVCEQVDLTQAKVVVELGAGTGALTQEIIRRIPQNCDFVIVERDREFAEMLKRRFNGAHVWATEAQNMHRYLDEHGFKKIDFFVSGLPFRSLPKTVGDEILKLIHDYLSPNGIFVSFSYFPNTYYQYKKFFSSVKTSWVLRNIPPAFVYACKKSL